MSEELHTRVSRIETGISAMMQQMAEQTAQLTRVANSIETVVRQTMDLKAGITPPELMYVSDHRAMMKTTIICFTVMLSVALGISKVSELGTAAKIAQQVAEKAQSLSQ